MPARVDGRIGRTDRRLVDANAVVQPSTCRAARFVRTAVERKGEQKRRRKSSDVHSHLLGAFVSPRMKSCDASHHTRTAGQPRMCERARPSGGLSCWTLCPTLRPLSLVAMCAG